MLSDYSSILTYLIYDSSRREKIMKVGEISRLLALPWAGNPETEIIAAAELDQAGREHISFLETEKYIAKAKSSQAGCIVVSSTIQLPDRTLLLSDSPRYDFIRVLGLLYPVSKPGPGIHESAVVARTATIAEDVVIGPYVVIEEDVTVMAGAWIAAHCFLGRGSRIGTGTRLLPRVTLYPGVTIGRDCIVHSGTVIGADGYGYYPHQGRHVKFPQIGNVAIGDEVEIGANVCIDRAALGTTRIGKGTKIDNLVQIAHNVEIGENCLVVAQVGISGSSRLGDQVTLAGQVGIGEHATLQSGVMVGGQSGVLNKKTLRPGPLYWGTPARPISEIQEQHRLLASVPRLLKEVEKLKKELDRSISPEKTD